MNCCLIEIFEIFETTNKAFNDAIEGCELLFNWDLWNIRNNIKGANASIKGVVNCCLIEIFEIFETTNAELEAQLTELWIAV